MFREVFESPYTNKNSNGCSAVSKNDIIKSNNVAMEKYSSW